MRTLDGLLVKCDEAKIAVDLTVIDGQVFVQAKEKADDEKLAHILKEWGASNEHSKNNQPAGI